MGWLTGTGAHGSSPETEGAPLLRPSLMARVRQIQILSLIHISEPTRPY